MAPRSSLAPPEAALRIPSPPGDHRPVLRWLVVLTTASALALGTAPAVAHVPAGMDDAGPAAAAVRIDRRALAGPRGTILATVRLRCAPGYTAAGMVLGFSQGAVIAPDATSAASPPCDGRWHTERVTSLEAFGAGPATMTARFSVVEDPTGMPAPEATDAARIVVRAAAAMRLGTSVHLDGDQATVRVRARCDEPWVESELGVEVSQPSGVAASGHLATGTLVCDGGWHTFRMVVVAEGELSLEPGPGLATASLTVLDPDFFDPVTQAQASREVVLH
jgi:hypothetical protein